MITVDEFSQLVADIYSTVLHPEQWDTSMAAIAHAFDAHSAALVVSDHDSRVITHTQIAPAAARCYAEHYQQLDHVLRAVEEGPVGAVRTGAELMWPHRNDEFQTDWARPNGCHDGLFVRLTPGPTIATLAIASDQSADRFDTPDRVALVNRLSPHLMQALRVQARLDDLDHRTEDLALAGESVGHGIVVVAHRRPVYVNAAAERILNSQDGLRIDGGRLHAQSVTADARLRRGLARALDLTDHDVWGDSFLCERPSGRRPYVVHVLPVDPKPLAAPRDRAMVVIVDPERQPEPPVELLRSLYGLTAGEAQVALLALRGEGLPPIADELSVSLPTVKTHLRHVFDKTGVHRQAELVRLLSTLDPYHR